MNGSQSSPGAQEIEPFLPWTPKTIRADQRHDGHAELKRLLSAAVEKFFSEELSAGATPPLPNHGRLLVARSADVEGFDNPLVCQIDKRSLTAICAALFGAAPEEAAGGDLIDSPMLAALVVHIQDALIDRFCKVASQFKGADFKRVADDRRGQPGSLDDESGAVLFEADAKGVSLLVAFQLSASDAARLSAATCAPDAASDVDGMEGLARKAVEQVEVTLEAVLDDRSATLEEIRNWKPGTLVPLRSTPRSLAMIVVQGECLFRCEIVRHDEFFALRVNGVVGAGEEPILEHQ